MAPSRAKEIHLSDFLLQTQTTLKNHFDLDQTDSDHFTEREREREKVRCPITICSNL